MIKISEEQEKKDIEMLKKRWVEIDEGGPELDITEVAYNEKGEITAMAVRDASKIPKNSRFRPFINFHP